MVDPLPLYVQDEPPQTAFDVLLTRIAVPISTTCPHARTILESFVESQKAPAYDDGPETFPQSSRDPIDQYPPPVNDLPHDVPSDLTLVKQQIVKELFNAIEREDAQAIALLIQHNLVTANTTSENGQTPLVQAISTKNIAIVKELVDFGAECNKFSAAIYGPNFNATRTPLMLAASLGSLPIVKFLFEPPHSANDALIASDGQIALRLAAENDHRAIVDYLPSRRGGGFLRFKTANARSFERIKKALRRIGTFVKFFVWYLPKFFVWDIPKHLVVLPVVKGCKWCWANRKKFGPWCKHQLTEMPKRVMRVGKAAWKATKKIPGAIWKAAKKTPGVLWKAIKKVAETVWRYLTVRIPNAIRAVLKWAWEGLCSLTQAIGDIFLRFVSFLHIVFEAILRFLRVVTLRDIWNAFCDFLRAVFVTLPKKLFIWIVDFWEACFVFMKALLGEIGEGLWWIATLIGCVVVYIPVKLGVILKTIGGSFAKAFTEIRVWISPKA